MINRTRHLIAVICLALVGPAGQLLALETTDAISILFGGDTSYGESYHDQYAAEGGVDIIASRGYGYSIAHLDALLANCDFNILNLETPLTSIRELPFEGKDYYHYSHPQDATAALRKHRVHAVSLANNHTLDFGSAGFHETLKSLRCGGIDWFGAGPDLDSAAAPLMKQFELGGRCFELAVFGVFESRESYEKYDFYATNDSRGAYRLVIDHLAEQIRKLKRQRPGVFVVVFPHWGSNYVWRSEHQQVLGRQIIDAGADLVIGHGAHCIQEIEHYHDRWIVYSIGNFMFNSRGRYSKLSAPPYSMPLVLSIRLHNGNLKKQIRLYPILSDNTKTNFQPRFVSQAEFLEVRQLLVKHSADADLKALMKTGADNIGSYLEIDVH